MIYSRAVELLDARQETRIRLGLGRIRKHLKSLGDPQDAYGCIHVAGTNGKGSVCAMLASTLEAAGWKTGLYISPHLTDIRERIQVNGRPIPSSDFARILERTLRHESKDQLTYFEIVTSMAFQYFKQAGVDIAVLETGLGGRYDATNAVGRPLATAIPSIDYDHMNFLGSSIASIAREKAGIFKRGSPAICAETKPEALRSIRRCARIVGATLQEIPPRLQWRTRRTDWMRGTQELRGPQNAKLEVRLLGNSQVRNVAVVLKTLEAVRGRGFAIPHRAIEAGLRRVRWPGRFETVRLGKRVLILDGAHNCGAMRNFCSTLKSSPWGKVPKTFVLGILRDKQHREMVRILSPYFERVIVTEPLSPRALSCGELAREIAEFAPKAKVSVIADPLEAIRAWRDGKEKTPVACLCGSFYLVGAALKILKRGGL